MTFEDRGPARARQYMRKAWDAAVDAHLGMRRVRVDIEKGSDAKLHGQRGADPRDLEVAKLTIHEQTPKPKRSTQSTSCCARASRGDVEIQAFPPSRRSRRRRWRRKTEQDYADEVVAGATPRTTAR